MEVVNDDDTPLLLATKRKRVGIVYELIKYGAKLSSADRVKFLQNYIFQIDSIIFL